MPDLTTSETLNLAADLIEERGWEQGRGWSESDSDAPLCLEGGIQAASRIPRDDLGELYSCPAYRAVQAFLGDRCRNNVLRMPTKELWAFNDTVATSAAEVIAVLRATAVIESAREVRTALAGLPGSPA